MLYNKQSITIKCTVQFKPGYPFPMEFSSMDREDMLFCSLPFPFMKSSIALTLQIKNSL
jgi:hypothetical protein